MNLCLLLHTFARGGVGNVTVDLAEALHRDYNVRILVLCQEEPVPYVLPEGVELDIIFTQMYPLRQLRRMARQPLRDYVRKHQIDTVILQTFFAGFAGSTLRATTDVKLIYCDHCSLIAQPDVSISDRLAAMVSAWRCHKIVLLSSRIIQAYKQRFGIPKRKMQVIYNSIDIHSDATTDEYRTDSRRVISAGRLTAEKGFDMLVTAWASVARRHPDWELDIYGDGELMPDLRARVDALGLTECVHLMGMHTVYSSVTVNMPCMCCRPIGRDCRWCCWRRSPTACPSSALTA